jgi:hypothetical protein
VADLNFELRSSVVHNNFFTFVQLLEQGANINAYDNLYYMVEYYRYDMLKLVLSCAKELKIDVNTRIGQHTPFSLALFNKRLNMVRLFLAYAKSTKLDVNFLVSYSWLSPRGYKSYKKTPLDMAETLEKSGRNVKDIIEKLKALGAKHYGE